MTDLAQGTPAETPPEFGEHGALLAELADQFDELHAGRAAENLLYCGLGGSGRSLLLQHALRLARARQLIVVHAGLSAAAGERSQLGQLFDLVSQALAGRRPGSLAVRELRLHVEQLSASWGSSAAALRPAELNELSRLTAMTAEAADESRESVVLVLSELGGTRSSMDVLAAMSRAVAPGQPLVLLASSLPPSDVPPRWSRRDLPPLRAAGVAEWTGQAPSSPAVARLVELTGGWPALVDAARRELDGSAVPWTTEDVERVAPGAIAALLLGRAGGLSSPERRYLRAMADLSGEGAAVAIEAVGRALGDTTRFSTESSALADIRTALLSRGVIYSPEPDQVGPAMVGLEHLWR